VCQPRSRCAHKTPDAFKIALLERRNIVVAGLVDYTCNAGAIRVRKRKSRTGWSCIKNAACYESLKAGNAYNAGIDPR